MRQLLFVCMVSATVITAACKKSCDDKNIPGCVKDEIEANKNNDDWEVGGVDEYKFQGQTVFAFTPDERIADGATTIKTVDCVFLCSVGGFGGPSINMCNGENFFEKAVFIRNIWKK